MHTPHGSGSGTSPLNHPLEAKSAVLEYARVSPVGHRVNPANVNRETLSLATGDRAEVAYFGRGPIILYVHGWAHSADRWLQVARSMDLSGFTHVAVDLPGFGHAHRQSLRRPVMESYRAFLEHTSESLCDRLGETLEAVVGHSLGGCVSARASQRTGGSAWASKLVLVDVPTCGIVLLRLLCVLFPFFWLAMALRRAVPKPISTHLIRAVSFLTTPSFDAMDDRLVADAMRPSALSLVRVLFAIAFFRLPPVPRPHCESIFFARGARDWLSRKTATDQLSSEWHATVRTFETSGHTPFMECPTEFAAWLRSVLQE